MIKKKKSNAENIIENKGFIKFIAIIDFAINVKSLFFAFMYMTNEKERKSIILARTLSLTSEQIIKIISFADKPDFLTSNEIKMMKAGIIRFVKQNIHNK